MITSHDSLSPETIATFGWLINYTFYVLIGIITSCANVLVKMSTDAGCCTEDWCSIGAPLSVIFSYIYMTKTERKVVEQTKPQIYKRFIENIINQPGNLFQALNSNHPKIKYTIEVDLDKFLDTKIILEIGIVTTEANQKVRKLSVHSTSVS